MKRAFLLLLPAVIALMVSPFLTPSYAARDKCDFSDPKDGFIDGSDLAQVAAYYAASDPMADVNGDGSVGPDDVAYFAGFFGTRPPNILLIIADDVGLDATTNLYPGLIDVLKGKYNNSNVQGTPAPLPNLTIRLATQGMVFQNAWAQPYCSPTRATVITGLFEDKTRVTGPDSPLLYNSDPSKRHITFVRKLQETGYSNAMIGKWHLAGNGTNGTLPKQAGFDYYRGHNAAYIPGYWSDGTNTANNYAIHWQDSGTAANTFNTIAAGSVTPRSLPAGTTAEISPATTYEPVIRAADAIDWINAHPDKPWFIWLAFNLSHVTLQTPNMHVPPKNLLDSVTISEMDACLPATPTPGQYGANPPKVGNCSGAQLHRAMTNAMDTAIGKVLDVIDFSNTYVIFIGDNGTPMYGGTYGNQIGNLYLDTTGRGKGSAWESGCRVPMAIRGPGIAAGAQKSAPVHVADLSATILTLAGLTPPAKNYDSTGAQVDSDSKSLTPMLFGTAEDSGRDPNEGYLLTETGTTYFGTRFLGARNATYKVLCPYSLGNMSNCDFYSLIDDPLEHNTALAKPSSCTNYRSNWSTTDPQWHFCRLWEVLNTYSILSP
jgi:arylsulfatase A-like enzyme